MLGMRIKLFTSVNNSECMKQHCTPPLSFTYVKKYSENEQTINMYNVISKP